MSKSLVSVPRGRGGTRRQRILSKTQVKQIAASIQHFRFTNPVLVDDANGIIAGHGHVLAAKSIGMECPLSSHV